MITQKIRVCAALLTLYCGTLIGCTLVCQVCDYKARLLAAPP